MLLPGYTDARYVSRPGIQTQGFLPTQFVIAAISPAANLGGFFDRELEVLLNVDGVDQSVLYAVAVGRRPS